MASDRKKGLVPRVNIYLPDAAMRRQVRAAAASLDLSLSDYCVEAIKAQLIKDGQRPAEETSNPLLRAAVRRARRFQTETFGGRVFDVSSAELIRQVRKERAGR